MKKTWCDRIGIVLLVCGIVALPLCRGHFGLPENQMTVLLCGGTIALLLVLKLIGYKTGYTAAERKEDRIPFILLCLLLCGVLVAGAFGVFDSGIRRC